MAEPFDPYRDWLGIAGGRRAAHFYRLFALRPFEADDATISQAAAATIERIRCIDPSGRDEAHGKLLAELENARNCLLDPAARSRYDRALRQRAAAAVQANAVQANAVQSNAVQSSAGSGAAGPAREAAPTPPVAEPLPTAMPLAPSAVAPPIVNQPAGANVPGEWDAALWDVGGHADPPSYATRTSRSWEHSPWRTPLAILLGLLIAVVILGVGAWLLSAVRRSPTAPTAQADDTPSSAATADDDSAQPDTSAHVSGAATDDSAGAIVARESRGAHSSRFLPLPLQERGGARGQGSGAAPRDTAPAGDPPAPTAPGDDGPRLPDAHWKFTRALNRARAALERRDVELARRQLALARELAPADAQRETTVRLTALADALARFLEAARSGLPKFTAADELTAGDEPVSVVSVGDDTLTVRTAGAQREYSLAALPAPLALVVARAGVDENASGSKVFFGALHAVDRQGDPALARQLWEAAAAAGEPVQPLLAILESNDLVIVREPLPPAEARQAAAQRVLREFDVTIRGARSPEQRTYLVEQLLLAATAAEDSADQFALASEACARAAIAGDARRAMTAVDELARWFQVDALALKTQTLVKTRAAAGDAEASRQVAVLALALADEARERDELARTLAMTAVAAARRADDAELLKQATVRRRQLERAAAGSKAKDAN